MLSLRSDKGNLRVDVSEKFFPVRVVRHQKRLLREVLDALSLKVFQFRLAGTLSNLHWWKVSLPCSRGVKTR